MIEIPALAVWAACAGQQHPIPGFRGLLGARELRLRTASSAARTVWLRALLGDGRRFPAGEERRWTWHYKDSGAAPGSFIANCGRSRPSVLPDGRGMRRDARFAVDFRQPLPDFFHPLKTSFFAVHRSRK
jgi:hypothetical protein